ncbi:MAG: hypothetical protein J0H19_03835 [Rhodospirillales bacterium]|nr:hypothetical protein [Rhodospirillales bacterium]MBN9559307.1 hypothetical protein [Alphaproteobacteria bacterium]
MSSPEPDAADEARSPWRAVIGLLLIVGLVVGVVFVMRELRQTAAVQDCVMAGRTNCAPVGRD